MTTTTYALDTGKYGTVSVVKKTNRNRKSTAVITDFESPKLERRFEKDFPEAVKVVMKDQRKGHEGETFTSFFFDNNVVQKIESL